VRRRHGSILLAVSLLVVIAALVAAGVLWSVEADGASERWRRRDDELRVLAQSGVRIAMVTLQSQRDDILAGADFEPPASATVYEDEESGRRAVVSFEAFPGEADAPERRAVAMAALCPLNEADARTLVTLGFGEEHANAIVAQRPAGGYALPDDLPNAPSASDLAADAGSLPPIDLLTTTSWDCDRPATASLPPRQGASPRRLVLGAGLDEQDRAWLAEALDADLAEIVAPLVADASWKGRTFGDATAALLAAGLSPVNLGRALDLLAADAGSYPKGRIDLGRAPAAVLMTLPGIDQALAERLVAARASLDTKARATIAWPLAEGVLDAARFGVVVDRLAGRSLQWRVRIRAEFEPSGGSRAAPDPEGGAVQDRRPSVTLDVILDAAGDVVRVVSMHESTWTAIAASSRDSSSSEPDDGPAIDPAQTPIQTSSEIGSRSDSPEPQPLRIKREPEQGPPDPSAASRQGRETSPGGRVGRWRPR
jgi:DNA uptake protein ComE-like DNA-binding protein